MLNVTEGGKGWRNQLWQIIVDIVPSSSGSKIFLTEVAKRTGSLCTFLRLDDGKRISSLLVVINLYWPSPSQEQ